MSKMSHVTTTGVNGKKQLAEVLAERGLSHRGFARLLVGTEADGRQLENKRRQVRAWVTRGGMSDRSAEAVARALELPADYFKTPRPARVPGEPRTVQQVLVLLRELAETVDDQQSTIDELRGKVELLERRPASRRRASAAH